jgi:hypothetical protein
VAFSAIAEMSSALAASDMPITPVFEPSLPAIAHHIRESIGLLKPKVSAWQRDAASLA